jgi:uncharacterized protein YfbU (UPF0304 family)
MELSKTERLMLYNQYEILKALYPEQKEDYEEAQEVLAHGYEHHYDNLAQFIDDKTMNDEDGRETIDILQMFESIQVAYDALDDKAGVNEYRATFRGFDGNHETKQMAYARFFCESDGERFVHLRKPEGFGGGVHQLPVYRGMLSEFNASAKKYKLTKDDLIRITNAEPER